MRPLVLAPPNDDLGVRERVEDRERTRVVDVQVRLDDPAHALGLEPARRIAGSTASSGVISGQEMSVVAPQWPRGSVATCGALPPSITTSPRGCVSRYHGVGFATVSPSRPSPRFMRLSGLWMTPHWK